MKVSLVILAVSWINLGLLSGCSINRADSLRMLNERADYEDPKTLHELNLKEAGIDGYSDSPVPVRTRPKVAAVWIHRHEMPSHDYFWGGWMSLIVEADQWVLTKPGELKSAPGVIDVTHVQGKKKNPRKVDAKPPLKP